MSLIFDALQKAEERSGNNVSSLTSAADLLAVVESKLVTQNGAARPANSAGAPQAANSAERLSGEPASTKPSVVSDADERLKQQAAEILERCKSLPISLAPEANLMCLTEGDSLAAEKFRFLAVKMRQFRRERPLQKVLITSTIPNEGKSMIAANLACSLARKRPQKVLLVEGDVRRPHISQMFGIGKLPGLCDWIQDNGAGASYVYHLDGPDMWILPAGSPAGNPLEVLQSAKLGLLMEQVTHAFDWVVVDSPPILPLADTSVWSRLADGILLVGRQGTTQRRQLKKGLDAIDRGKLIGSVLNSAHSPAHHDYYYRYSASAVSSSLDDTNN